ncbi:MAG: phosphoglycerate kinase [Candidatus Nomurabacteria bacterium]|jgi:3-phosphoglycerate kinase|nr:phosphoglycerate kinase [Candidatus Nomurabacteria bacterium]
MSVKFPRKTWQDVDLVGKTVLVRVDYNVPLRDGKIEDDFRIVATLPMLRKLVEKKCRVVLISHLGRPEGFDESLSLRPVAERLSELLGRVVGFVPDCVGDKVKTAVKKMSVGEILLLENLRFYSEEETNDMDFAKQLAKSALAKIFIQNGYGVVHRAHASTDAITNFTPSVAGPLVVEEWLNIQKAIENPNRPLVAVLGGAKIADKLPLIERIVEISDKVVLGGAVANNFLMSLGFSVGASLWNPEIDQQTDKIISLAKKKFGANWKQFFIVPVDVAVSKNGNPDGARHVVARAAVGANNAIFDVGTKSINRATEAITAAGTVIWNGTFGVADKPNFAHASSRIALTLANNPQIYSLVCGGDTVDFVRGWDNLKGGSFSYLSTGGGAALNQIAGKKLYGIDSLLC